MTSNLALLHSPTVNRGSTITEDSQKLEFVRKRETKAAEKMTTISRLPVLNRPNVDFRLTIDTVEKPVFSFKSGEQHWIEDELVVAPMLMYFTLKTGYTINGKLSYPKGQIWEELGSFDSNNPSPTAFHQNISRSHLKNFEGRLELRLCVESHRSKKAKIQGQPRNQPDVMLGN